MSGSIPKRKYFTLATSLVVVGIIFAATGILSNRNSTISADVESSVSSDPTGITPPTPTDPDDASSDDPTQSQNFTFPAGWSMISAKQIRGRNLTTLNESGILLYSFNDPNYPVTDWTVFPGLAQDNTTVSLKPIWPLGYYVYNPADVKTVTLSATTNSVGSKIFGRGWHLFFWSGDTITRSELLSKIKISYSDNTVLTGAQAIADESHRASVKIYVVTNEKDIDFNKSVKELTGADSDTTVSKLPKNSYYWFYLRRTKDRVSSFAYQTASATTSATATTTDPDSTDSELDISPPVPEIPATTNTAD